MEIKIQFDGKSGNVSQITPRIWQSLSSLSRRTKPPVSKQSRRHVPPGTITVAIPRHCIALRSANYPNSKSKIVTRETAGYEQRCTPIIYSRAWARRSLFDRKSREEVRYCSLQTERERERENGGKLDPSRRDLWCDADWGESSFEFKGWARDLDVTLRENVQERITERERERKRMRKGGERREREGEKGADSEPFLILAERGFKGISAVSRNALNFPPTSRRERRVTTFRFSSALSRIFAPARVCGSSATAIVLIPFADFHGDWNVRSRRCFVWNALLADSREQVEKFRSWKDGLTWNRKQWQ